MQLLVQASLSLVATALDEGMTQSGSNRVVIVADIKLKEN